ncbi:MAG: GGDEF domain-containing protein [Campylobacter sp.]
MFGESVFSWNSEFETSIVSIDLEHKTLVDIVNKLGSALSDDNLCFDMLEPIFKELFDYTNYHFKNEEGLSAKMNVDERHRKEHKKAHKMFLQRVTTLYENLKFSEFKTSNFKELLDFLVYWLTFHILGMDQKLARQIQKIQEGKIPEVAYDETNTSEYSQLNMLVRSFNGAFESLMKYNKELLELKESLEEQITLRTMELQRANEQLEQIAMYDYLTGLANRRKAMKDLERCREIFDQTNEKFSVIMVDLDDFKYINDNYGHDSGDKVLYETAKIIKHNIRMDDIACRLGGDEFLVICQNTDSQGALVVAKKLHSAIDELSLKFQDKICKVPASIGVASWNSSMKSIKDILKSVDIGLYSAKDRGKNTIVTQQ